MPDQDIATVTSHQRRDKTEDLPQAGGDKDTLNAVWDPSTEKGGLGKSWEM